MPVSHYWKEINESSKRVTSLMHSYWHEHSDWGNWQFWLLLLCLLVPLVVLLIKLDRNRIFEILFFGYTVHMLWTYTDLALIRQGYIDHYYFLMPFLPQAFGITASLIPVSFMLLYQYCTNQEKPFILWTAGLSALFALGFAPIEIFVGLVSITKGLTIVHLFFLDFTISMVAYGMAQYIINHFKERQST